MVKVAFGEFAPPGAGLDTESGALPAMARSVACSRAVNCVELTNAVVRSRPSHRTTEPLTNPAPLIVNVRSALPAPTDDGASVAIVGAECPLSIAGLSPP